MFQTTSKTPRLVELVGFFRAFISSKNSENRFSPEILTWTPVALWKCLACPHLFSSLKTSETRKKTEVRKFVISKSKSKIVFLRSNLKKSLFPINNKSCTPLLIMLTWATSRTFQEGVKIEVI